MIHLPGPVVHPSPALLVAQLRPALAAAVALGLQNRGAEFGPSSVRAEVVGLSHLSAWYLEGGPRADRAFQGTGVHRQRPAGVIAASVYACVIAEQEAP